MPKFKTRKSFAKRFTVTKNGKVIRRCAKSRHLATAKSRKKKRQIRGGSAASRPDAINIRAVLPY